MKAIVYNNPTYLIARFVTSIKPFIDLKYNKKKASFSLKHLGETPIICLLYNTSLRSI